jgi:1-acyl-sn-glycerol-3-phosphate acyltransferase
MTTSWEVPWVWRVLLRAAVVLVAPICRLRVTVTDPEALAHGPLILAANHLSPVDPIIMTAACAKAGVAPRFMATGGLFRAPVVGSAMRAMGHLRVDRGSATVAQSIPDAAAALKINSIVFVYPEGRIGLDPWLWPERGRTGVARLAALSGAPVLPVAQWGAHAVMPYGTPRGLIRSVLRALVRRPVVQVRFGTPVNLDGLTGTAGAQAMQATRRIMDAVDATLVPLRPDEPEVPHHIDPTRPADLTRARRPR